jgi:hypothetical protein
LSILTVRGESCMFPGTYVDGDVTRYRVTQVVKAPACRAPTGRCVSGIRRGL